MSSRRRLADSPARLEALALALTTLVFGSCGPALAEAGQSASAWPAVLQVCRTIARDAERLQCYDRAAAALAGGGDLQDRPITPQEVFGASTLPTRAETQHPLVERAAIDSITATVRSVVPAGRGLIVIELDNGQVWRQDEERQLSINVGDTVKISRAALGTFRVVDDRGRFARFKRIR